MMGKLILYITLGLIGSFNLLREVPIDTINNSESQTVFYSADFRNVIFLQSKYADTTLIDSIKSCTDCHEDQLKAENVHSPVKKDCERCHVSTGAEHPLENTPGFTLADPVPALCYGCHDAKNEEEFVHEPTGKGDCGLCHDFHKSDNLYLVKSNPVSNICYECHDLNIPESNHVHGAVTEGNCVGCHNPHSAGNSAMLANTKLDRLCKKCHRDFRKELKMEHVHGPFDSKNCFECHEAHSSKEAHLSNLKTKDLCLSCHEALHTELKGSKMIHGALNDEESCLNCHSAHASNKEHILKKDSTDLCLGCHNDKIETETGFIDAIGPHLKEGNSVHAAITQEGCSVCHGSHASMEHSLLNETFPEDNYVNSIEESFNMCFKCHNKDLLKVEKSSTITDFRDGEENLHFLHISKGKGRNCTICHDIHGTENKFMIKKTTKFGNWDMPVNYESSITGGACRTACHDERKYNRSNPVYQY